MFDNYYMCDEWTESYLSALRHFHDKEQLLILLSKTDTVTNNDKKPDYITKNIHYLDGHHGSLFKKNLNGEVCFEFLEK